MTGVQTCALPISVVADQVGCDFIGLGEHHRPDFAVTTPEMVLATIAGRTSRIKLGSAVTVLSSDDPVRVFQDFATLDLISHGRAEIMAGRGSFIESFPLFGQALARQAAQVLAVLPAPVLLEVGAGSGRLAADLLLELEKLGSLPERYAILEQIGRAHV